MPELGGKALQGELGVALKGLKKALEGLRMDAAGAVTELTQEIAAGKQGVKMIQDEARAVRDAFSEIVGNGGGAVDAEKRQDEKKPEAGQQSTTDQTQPGEQKS